MRKTKSSLKLKSIVVLTLLLALFLSACSGGDGDSPITTPTGGSDNPGGGGISQKTITGVVAAGAPVVGIVNVKGANGATASATIEADGSYSLDVTNLTAPYILYAEGSVNGKSVKIYSAGVADGNINITPVTDFILRNVLGGSADNAYQSWSTSSVQVTQSSLDSAETYVQQQLQPLLTAASIADTVNLISTSFSADHTGLDAVLDALNIVYDTTGTVATVTNNLTGSTYTDNVTTSTDNQTASLPIADQTQSTTALGDAQQIDQVLQALENLYTTGIPAPNDLTNWFNTYVASDIVDEGETRDQILNSWLSGDGPVAGFTISVTIVEPMSSVPAPYLKGYLTMIYYSDPFGPEIFPAYMVYNGTNWLWYGDQRWVDISFSPVANKWVNAQGNSGFQTGFELWIGDDMNYAYNNGIRSAVYNGPGLNNVIMEHLFPENRFGIYGMNGGTWYLITDDSLISSIPNNAEYTIKLCSEDATALASGAVCTALQTYTETIGKRPLLNSELNGPFYPTLTQPASHSLSDLNFGGLITISWTNPSNTEVMDATLAWNDTLNTFHRLDAEIFGSTTVTLDATSYTGQSAPGNWGAIWLFGEDIYGRDFVHTWDFQ